MMTSDFTLNEYHELLYRAAQPASNKTQPAIHADLSQLSKIINIDLPELARQGSPDDFADILQKFRYELQRFHDFCAFPDLSQRNIVGIGGRFSAGKSSFINKLLGKKFLNADVNPTTSLPTYLLHGDSNAIHAINLFQQSVDLSEREFGSLTHEVQKELGNQVGALLQSAHIQTPEFPWQNLAVLDTPGYTNPQTEEYSERTDEHIAHAQLNSTNYLLWLVSAEDGTITEDDIRFLSSLNAKIPRLVLVNKSDKKTPEDVQAIVALIRKTLADRNIPAIDVIPVSARRTDHYPLEPVWEYLNQWNSQERETTFARRFKTLFMQYSHYFETEQRQTAMQLNRLNRILTLSDNQDITQDAEGLQVQAKIAMELLNQQSDELTAMQALFFKLLKQIGDHVGIAIPEPSDLAMLDLGESKLPALLAELCKQTGLPEKDYSHYWQDLMTSAPLPNLDKLLRRMPQDHATNTLFSGL